jgi:2Fe-2S ferredoxin
VDIGVGPDETLIEAAWRSGYYWPTVCYGQAQCTTCHVKVLQGEDHLVPPEDEETNALRTLLVRPAGRRRLACRLKVTGPAVVEKRGVRRAWD